MAETGLVIKVGNFQFSCEFIKTPLHALEMFFSAEIVSGVITKGIDPEMGKHQIIQEVEFMDFDQINNLKNEENLIAISQRGTFKDH